MTKEKNTKLPVFLLISGSIISLLLWIVILFYALLLGGNPGPGYERSVPYSYANFMWLGLMGAMIGLIAGTKSMRNAKPATRVLIFIAALLGAAGSIVFFLMDLASVGFFYCLVGIAPPAMFFLATYLIDCKKRSRR